MSAALALGLALAAGAGAETLTRTIGPVVLEGPSSPFEGPEASATLRFERPGYVTALSVEVLDDAGRSHDHEGLNCHSLFDSAGLEPRDASGAGARSGVTAEPDRFGLSDNQTRISFPAGFGVKVGPESPYRLSGQLQNPGGRHDGRYSLKYSFELAPAGEKLRELTGLLVKIKRGEGADASPHDCGPMSLWMVPPGRHEYHRAFKMPYDARLHYVSTHVHARAVEVSMLDSRGRALLSAPVRHNAAGELDLTPVYSSAEGLALRKGESYTFSLVYDNPGPGPVDAMGNLRLWVSR
jgi:hypothetical protein